MQINNLNLAFAANIRYLRYALGYLERNKPYRQMEFAKLLNVNYTTISRWERGYLPSNRQLHRLAKFFTERFKITINPEDLLYRDIRNVVKIVNDQVVIQQNEANKLRLLRDFEMFARENLTEKDIETLIKIAKLLKERGEI